MQVPETVKVRVNGTVVEVPAGATAAVAMVIARGFSRVSVSGQPRMPFCGMGTCFECRCEINGKTQRLGCQVICAPEMEVRTNG